MSYTVKKREEVIRYWKLLKESELIEQGITGKEKEERLQPSGATIVVIEKAILEGIQMKELDGILGQFAQEIFKRLREQNVSDDMIASIRHERREMQRWKDEQGI